jgi:hypothetical protein
MRSSWPLSDESGGKRLKLTMKFKTFACIRSPEKFGLSFLFSPPLSNKNVSGSVSVGKVSSQIWHQSDEWQENAQN